jgi:hypothetical protein
MKHLMIILITVFSASAAIAQPGKGGNPGPGIQRLEAMHVAYLTRELALTPEEAQQFWPVYNKYRKDLKSAFDRSAPNPDPLDRQQKMLDIRKKYREEFSKSLGKDRANKVFGSADRFREMVKHEAERRRKSVPQQRPQQRPHQKKNRMPLEQTPL